MVLKELLAILGNDTELSTLLNSSISNKRIMPIPLLTDGIGFNFIPLICDGVIQQSQFELTIVNKDLFKCNEIKERIDKLLLTIGNDNLTSTILSISQNGGGKYFDNDLKMHKLQVNYTIKERMM